MKIIGDKYSLRCCEMKFKNKINLASVADVMVNNSPLERQYFDENQDSDIANLLLNKI